MCNAWNHPPGCTCGWGGEGHLGGGGGGSYGFTTTTFEPFSRREGALTSYRYESSDFCRATTCPECGAEVFFIRHNGGSVWVDELGWPWPKHGCFDESSSTTGYRFIADLGIRYAELVTKPKLGRVIKRIYRNFDHVYLIDTHEGRLSALSASRFEHTVFTDLVAIRYTDDKIFLEDSRGAPARVRNFRLTEETMQKYLSTQGEILYVPRPPPTRQPRELVTCGHCGQRIRKTRLQKHIAKVHGGRR
jgi:hypothetical protein